MRQFALLITLLFAQITFAEPLTYRIYKGDSRDLIYHFRGYYKAPADQLRAWWKQNNRPAPTIVSIDAWLLKSPGQLDEFLEETIPQIESAIGGWKGKRMVMGEAMGGFNAIQAALKGGVFQKAAIVCADISGARPYFTDAEDWYNADPLVLAAAPTVNPGIVRTDFYVAAGPDKNYELNEQFATILQRRGFKVTWQPMTDSNCVMDFPSIADFLTR